MSGAFNNDGRGISPLIATSWERCNKLMKRETWNVPHQAQGVTFASIYRRKKAMLTLGQAALEDAWEYMAPRECALLILDETACILSRNGDPQTLQQLSVLGFNDGTYCAEGNYWYLCAIVSGYLWSGRENDGRSTFQTGTLELGLLRNAVV